jgi:hypothetical protein
MRSWRPATKEPISKHIMTHRSSSVSGLARKSSLQYLCCHRKASRILDYKFLISYFLMQSLRHWSTLPIVWINYNTLHSRTLTCWTNLSLGCSATSTHVPYSSRVWHIEAKTWSELSPSNSCSAFLTGGSRINSRNSELSNWDFIWIALYNLPWRPYPCATLNWSPTAYQCCVSISETQTP